MALVKKFVRTPPSPITTAAVSLAEANYGHLVGKLVCIQGADAVLWHTLDQQRIHELDTKKYSMISNTTSFQLYDPTNIRPLVNQLLDVYEFGNLLGLVVEVGTCSKYFGHLAGISVVQQQEPVAVILRDEHLIVARAHLLRFFVCPPPVAHPTV